MLGSAYIDKYFTEKMKGSTIDEMECREEKNSRPETSPKEP